MMMEGGMIDTNRYDGVMFPISMCVRGDGILITQLTVILNVGMET